MGDNLNSEIVYIFKKLWGAPPSDTIINEAYSYLRSIAEDENLFKNYPKRSCIDYIAFMTLGYGIIHASYLTILWQKIFTNNKSIIYNKTPIPLFLLTSPYRFIGDQYKYEIEILTDIIKFYSNPNSRESSYTSINKRPLYCNSVASFKTPYEPPECKSAAKNILKLSKARTEYFKSKYKISEYSLRTHYKELKTIIWWLQPLSNILLDLVQSYRLKSDWFNIEKEMLSDLGFSL